MMTGPRRTPPPSTRLSRAWSDLIRRPAQGKRRFRGKRSDEVAFQAASLPNYAYEPASEIAHLLTRVLSPGHIAPAAVKVRGSRVGPVS
jgi:hypothetical protein